MSGIPTLRFTPLLLLGLLISGAAAGPITLTGSTSGTFRDPVPPDCVGTLSDACGAYVYFEGWDLLMGESTAFDWGYPGTIFTMSQLVLSKEKFSIQPSEIFVASTLQFRNLLNTAPLNMSVGLDFALMFTQPDVTSGKVEIPMTFGIHNTPDRIRWPLNQSELNPDTLTLPTQFAGVEFVSGSYLYTVHLLGFYQDGVQLSHLVVGEPGVRSADLLARIDVVKTPEPASLGLLALGSLLVASSLSWRRMRRG